MSKNYFQVSCESTDLAFCCGVKELGEFEAELVNIYGEGQPVDLPGQRPLNSKEKEQLRENWARKIYEYLVYGKPLLLTVVKRHGHTKYDNQCLVDAINEHPDALDCGSSINPNTGNTVTVYMIYPPQKGKK